MIEVHGLTQRYGAYTAVRDLSFALEAGEVVGFLGPNGAGKSTTLKVVSAFLAPSEGRVTVGGHDVLSDPLGVRQVLGYLPEHCPLYDEMLVRDHLAFVARVRGYTATERAGVVGRAAERCGLGEVISRPVRALSKGFRQRVGLAQAILHDPPVVVLDEPTSGLDPLQVREVRALVRELGQERTVLFSSHVLSEVEATVGRVVVIHRGRRVADAPLTKLAAQVTGGAVECAFAGAGDGLEQALAGLDGVSEVAALEAPAGEVAFRVRPSAGVGDLPARLSGFAGAAGHTLVRLAPQRVTLEDVFLTLTGERS